MVELSLARIALFDYMANHARKTASEQSHKSPNLQTLNRVEIPLLQSRPTLQKGSSKVQTKHLKPKSVYFSKKSGQGR